MALSLRKSWSTKDPERLQEELQELQRAVSDELARLGARARVRASTGDTIFAGYDEVVRLDPGSAGQALALPPPVPARAGATVEAIIGSDDGVVTVEVVDGLIDEQSSITLSPRVARARFVCDGVGWFHGPTLPTSLTLAVLGAAYPVGSIYFSTNSTNPATSLGFGTWSAFGAGRVPVGLDAGQTEFDTDEETGGSKTHTLTSSEMPSHTHTQDAHTHTQNSHNHTQDSHNHTQNAHTHTQNSHNHTQDAHTHTQNAHSHGVTDPGHAHGVAESNTPADGSAFLKATSPIDSSPALNTDSATADVTVDNATATNQNTTATNQAATATNQNATATNIATTATNQAATAVNQNATATNQNTGGGGAHNNLQPYIVVRMWKRTA